MCVCIVMALLTCPLCCQSCFSSVDLLRTSLISIISRPLICPICSAVEHSLDDLATHLTQHIEVPSQFGNQNEHCDANNVIHNININNGNDHRSGTNQFADENECDGNMTPKLDASSPPPPPMTMLVHDTDFNEPLKINAQNQSHMVVPFVCNLCDCSFRSLELRQMHMKLVHEINIRPSNKDNKLANARVISPAILQCQLCPKRFKMAASLRLHVRMVHGVSHGSMQKISTTNALSVGESTNNDLVATAAAGNEKEMETGDLIVSAKSPLPTHVNNSSNQPHIHNNQSDCFNNYGPVDVVTFGNDEHKDIECPSNGNNNSKEMIASNEERVHKCDICNKRFTTKYFLKKHKRLHTGEMPYTCELCHRTFTFQQSYHRHLSYHTNDRPHSCSICGRAFKELSTLHNHQRIHSGEKPFECETCGKCFRQRVSYLVHRRIHTGVMPYNCITCDKKFRYKISLRTHKCIGFVAADDTSTTVNNDATFMDDDHQNMSTCTQSLDELITESCNRMGIVDQSESNRGESTSYTNQHTENGINTNSPMLQFECDSFNLNDLAFCTGESSNTDLANVMPSMNEIFPQTIELMNALYDNVHVNNDDLQHFYDNIAPPQ